MPTTLFTIGHASHPVERVIAWLRQNGVTAVADVRSAPYSRHAPQFGRDALRTQLARHDIDYVFLGQELGGRPSDAACYVDGRVDYARLARTPAFRAGIARVVTGTRTRSVALMCAERDPLECHRAILVCRGLRRQVPDIVHILADGSLERHADAEHRLVVLTGLEAPHLFSSKSDLVERAYDRQAARIAFTLDTEGARR
jgi:uncharacterized protein (DUF488 family)